MSLNRIVRIVVGLALIGYGAYSGIVWFYLGVVPLITGIINWCPLEMKMGTCDPATGCCATPTDSKEGSACCTPSTVQQSVAKATPTPQQVTNFSFAPKKNTIEVLGTGCKKCKELELLAKQAVEASQSDYEVVKVEDIQEIMQYGVTSTPALVINGVVKSTGRVLSVDEIKELL